jgi:hypothetical protein
MTEKALIEIAQNELANPSSAWSEALIKTYPCVTENGKATIARVDLDIYEGIGAAYAPVKDERFFLVVFVDLSTGAVTGVATESWNRIKFTAISETLSAEALRQLTSIKPNSIINKGDKIGPDTYSYSSISVVIDSAIPESVEAKLRKLLNILKEDPDGIKQLVEQADGEIVVAIDYPVRTGSLGDIMLENDILRDIAALGLSINWHAFTSEMNVLTADQQNVLDKLNNTNDKS